MSELLVAAASTLEQANTVLARFLGEYNQQFAKPADQRAARTGSWMGV